ncbi:H-NS family nucleoid-associated regulatory protein [Primorskyibacter sp. S87]|uniref:H-NS histone family protein n=1 Tax=Primorskyibacter sp. S87 TaxID=3415126 RepID=UPI003C7CBB1F
MAIDLSTMSKKELVKLKSDVEKEIIAAENRERTAALEAARKAAAEYGFTLQELNVTSGAARKGAKTAAKYKNPANPGETWSGRGRKPKWVHDALAKGTDMSELEI